MSRWDPDEQLLQVLRNRDRLFPEDPWMELEELVEITWRRKRTVLSALEAMERTGSAARDDQGRWRYVAVSDMQRSDPAQDMAATLILAGAMLEWLNIETSEEERRQLVRDIMQGITVRRSMKEA